MGVFFVWLTARETLQIFQTWRWTKTDCEIVASRVRETDDRGKRTGSFYFAVEYRYAFAGRMFASDRYTRKTESFSDYGETAHLAEQYPPGSRAVCYVNPSSPSEAILKRGNPWFALVVLFPMIFVAIGAGGIYLTWRGKPAKEATAISDRARPAKSRRLVPLILLMLLLMGGGLLYPFVLRPLFRIIDARSWARVPCMVISSEVKSHSGNDGTTYSVNILYAYEYQESEFRSNRYDFMGGSSSGYRGKQEIVSRHPRGAKTFCYVNPRDPTEAVLDRGFSPLMWFGLIPLVFVLIGAGGLIGALRKSNRSAGIIVAPDPASTGSRVQHAPADSGTIILNPKTTPGAKLLVAILVVSFWNGIVSVFVVQVIDSWRSGRPEWFLAIFMIPFVLVGVGGIVMVAYFFLALFNPRPELMVMPGVVRLGERLEVWWEFSGRAHVLRRVHVWLEGREEASYRRGTQNYTDKNVFVRLDIAQGTMHSGIGSVTVPADSMHSFAGDNNKIIWSLHVKGEITLWADVSEEFPITVLPADATRTART